MASSRLPPRRDEFEEGEDFEVLPVEGREAAGAGEFEGRGEGRVGIPLSAGGSGPGSRPGSVTEYTPERLD